MENKIQKVSIIISKGSLESIYPGLILANGARMEGIEADLFFTFFGLEAIVKNKMDKIKVSAVGNPALHLPTLIGALPGVSSIITNKMKNEMEKLDIPPVGEFLEMIHLAGGRLFACKASVDMFKLKKDDFCDQVEDIISVGQFYERSAGAQIIYT